MKPKVNKSEAEVIKREPIGSQRSQKGAKREQKGAKMEPKSDHNASRKSSFGKGRENDRKREVKTPTMIYFGEHFSTQNR